MKRKATLEVEYGVVARGLTAHEWERILGNGYGLNAPSHVRVVVLSDEAVELQP